jgi:type IV secretion system protein TrbL
MKVARLLFTVPLLLAPIAAYAQSTGGPTVASDRVLATLQRTIATWNAPAAAIGMDLLIGLGIIAFALQVGYSIAQEQGFNPMALGAMLIRQVVFLGFWIWMLQNWASSFGSAIIKSFQQAGTSMGGVYADPASVIAQGGNVAATLFSQTSILHPGTAVGLCICAILIFLLLLGTAILMMLSLAKALIAVGVGGIAMGFAGFPETRGIGYNAVFMTIAAGSRLFMIQLMAGMGVTILTGLVGTGPLGQDDVWPILAVAGIWLCLTFSLPAMVEHMFGGAGHARAGAGQLFTATSSAASTGIALATGNPASLAASIGSAGRSMISSLGGSGGGGGSSGASGGSGRLPSGAGSTGSGASSAAAGSRMRASGSRYTGP